VTRPDRPSAATRRAERDSVLVTAARDRIAGGAGRGTLCYHSLEL